MGPSIEAILGRTCTCGCTAPERVAGNDVFPIGLQHGV